MINHTPELLTTSSPNTKYACVPPVTDSDRDIKVNNLSKAPS